MQYQNFIQNGGDKAENKSNNIQEEIISRKEYSRSLSK